MSAFCLVAESGSFASAAERMNVSGPMISKRIAHLEGQLGVCLINRTTRKVNLTETGRQYYSRCKQLLNDLADLEEFANRSDHSPRGILRINAPVDFGMMHMADAMEKFRLACPGVEIHLVLENRYIDLNDGVFDVVIRITDEPDIDAVSKVIRTTELCCYASPDYLRKFQRPERIDDLKQHRCLRFLGTPHGENWIFQDQGKIRYFHPQWCFASNNGSVLCRAAEKGVGIIQAPDVTVEPYLKSGALEKVLTRYRVASLPIYAMYLSRRFVPIKIQSFVKFLEEYFDSAADRNR